MDYTLKPDYTWHTKVTTYDAGQDRRLRLSALLRLQQEVGELHLGEGGLTYQELYAHNLVFVLTRLNQIIHRLPVMGQEIQVKTWHQTNKGVQFYRCYQILDMDGVPLTEGVTAFALIDADTHKLLRPSVFDQFDLPRQPDRVNGCPPPAKLRLPEDMAPAGAREIRWSDTDYNGHLNNTVYADILCDYLPHEPGTGSMAGRDITGFSISYEREALEGESLSIYTAREPGTVWMAGDHGRGRCFEACVTFRE
jgi:medium-chain acyl-[acyl-carrier-protein] hydrolase